MNCLLSALINEQAAAAENDTDFSTRIGVGRRLWGMTRKEEVEIGIKIIQAVTRKLPQYIPEMIEYLRNGNNNDSNLSTGG